MVDQEGIIIKELRKEINVLKSKKEDEIDLLEWRLRMGKMLMKDNDKDEYFQYTELDKIKSKSKKEADKINKLIGIKEWNIMDTKLQDYKRDVFFLIVFQSFFLFLQTYYDICFFHTLFLYFFLLQIILCIYFLLSLSLSLS